MLLQEFKKQFLLTLTSLYENNEAQELFYLICEDYLRFSKVDVALNFDYVLDTEKKRLFENALFQLQQQQPIQQILGEAYFYGNAFKVTKDTLIPRPETEELVDWIVTDHKDKNVSILDIGTGTGCIAISLKTNLINSKVCALDFSEKALTIAKLNSEKIGASIIFKKQDILTQENLLGDFDIIVSNPPYVRELEKKEMSTNVLDFEPVSALFVSDNDPLIFYRKIAKLIVDSYTNTQKPRFLYFEINEYLSESLIQMLSKMKYHSIELRKDFRGKPRMIKAVIGKP